MSYDGALKIAAMAVGAGAVGLLAYEELKHPGGGGFPHIPISPPAPPLKPSDIECDVVVEPGTCRISYALYDLRKYPKKKVSEWTLESPSLGELLLDGLVALATGGLAAGIIAGYEAIKGMINHQTIQNSIRAASHKAISAHAACINNEAAKKGGTHVNPRSGGRLIDWANSFTPPEPATVQAEAKTMQQLHELATQFKASAADISAATQIIHSAYVFARKGDRAFGEQQYAKQDQAARTRLVNGLKTKNNYDLMAWMEWEQSTASSNYKYQDWGSEDVKSSGQVLSDPGFFAAMFAKYPYSCGDVLDYVYDATKGSVYYTTGSFTCTNDWNLAVRMWMQAFATNPGTFKNDDLWHFMVACIDRNIMNRDQSGTYVVSPDWCLLSDTAKGYFRVLMPTSACGSLPK